jgi:hypothetical protein
MPTVYGVAALAVAALYLLWRAYAEVQQQRQSLLCRRVAYLLWVVAEADESAMSWHAGPHCAEDCGYE